MVGDGVLPVESVFVLDDPLSHGGDYVVVPVSDGLQDVHEPEIGGEWKEEKRKEQGDEDKTEGKIGRWQGLGSRKKVEKRYPVQFCPSLAGGCASLTFQGLCGHRGSCPGSPGSPSGSEYT